MDAVDTKLSDVLESPRAIKALEKAGFKTLEDLNGVPLANIIALKGVGQRTLEVIRGIVDPDEESFDEGSIEECDAPIHLISKRQKYVIWVLRGDKVVDQASGSSRSVPPVLIEFTKGRGVITRDKYLMRRYKRNETAIAQHIEEGRPWRIECAEWLKGRQKHRLEYELMTD